MAMPSVTLQSILQNSSSRTNEQLEKELIDYIQTEITRKDIVRQKISIDATVNNIKERDLLQIVQSKLSNDQKSLMAKQFNTALQKVLRKLNLDVKIKNVQIEKISALKARLEKLRERLRYRRKKRKQTAKEESEMFAAIDEEMKEKKHNREQEEELEKKRLEDEKRLYNLRHPILPPEVLTNHFISYLELMQDDLASTLKQHNIDAPEPSKIEQEHDHKELHKIHVQAKKEREKHGTISKQTEERANHFMHRRFARLEKAVQKNGHPEAIEALKTSQDGATNVFLHSLKTGRYDPNMNVNQAWAKYARAKKSTEPALEEPGVKVFTPSYTSKQEAPIGIPEPNALTERQKLDETNKIPDALNPQITPKPRQ